MRTLKIRGTRKKSLLRKKKALSKATEAVPRYKGSEGRPRHPFS